MGLAAGLGLGSSVPALQVVATMSTLLEEDGGWTHDDTLELLGLIMLDHSYSKPFNWRPELGFGAKPTRYLFGSNEPRSQGATSPTQV